MKTLGPSDYIAIWVIFMCGVMLVWAGMTGRLGDMLAALVSPSALQDETNGTVP